MVCHRSTKACRVGSYTNTGGFANATLVGLVTDIAVQMNGLSIIRQVTNKNRPAMIQNRRRRGAGTPGRLGRR